MRLQRASYSTFCTRSAVQHTRKGKMAVVGRWQRMCGGGLHGKALLTSKSDVTAGHRTAPSAPCPLSDCAALQVDGCRALAERVRENAAQEGAANIEL
jgi:hypothetical protein